MYETTGMNTPFYVYDLDLLHRTVSRAMNEARMYGYHLHYAVKANADDKVLEVVRKRGLGADCVSGNEMMHAIEQGFDASKVVLAGVGKTDFDIQRALAAGILSLNVESVEELKVVAEIARSMEIPARVCLRVNPGVDAQTHAHITTGLNENKFGISLLHLQYALDFIQSEPYLDFAGLHFHIGSQIRTTKPYIQLAAKASEIWRSFGVSELGGRMLNLGGGMGINYSDPHEEPIPDFRSFFRLIEQNLQIPSNVSIHFEPGRSLVGQCASLITKVLYVKQGVNKQFAIVDAGMTELLRPALYGALHKIENLSSEATLEAYDVVGPICESADTFGKDVLLPAVKRGDWLAIRSCGAYAASMNLSYNMRSQAKNIYYKGGVFTTAENPGGKVSNTFLTHFQNQLACIQQKLILNQDLCQQMHN